MFSKFVKWQRIKKAVLLCLKLRTWCFNWPDISVPSQCNSTIVSSVYEHTACLYIRERWNVLILSAKPLTKSLLFRRSLKSAISWFTRNIRSKHNYARLQTYKSITALVRISTCFSKLPTDFEVYKEAEIFSSLNSTETLTVFAAFLFSSCFLQ